MLAWTASRLIAEWPSLTCLTRQLDNSLGRPEKVFRLKKS